jgi:hypothetical protein
VQTVVVPRRLDLLPMTACVLALAVTVLYLLLVRLERGDPTVWAVVILVVSVGGTAYASARRAPLRRAVLVACALGLAALGYLAILSIGLPLLLAAALCVSAVLRGRPARDWRDTV